MFLSQTSAKKTTFVIQQQTKIQQHLLAQEKLYYLQNFILLIQKQTHHWKPTQLEKYGLKVRKYVKAIGTIKKKQIKHLMHILIQEKVPIYEQET